MRIALVDAATTRELRRAVLRPGWPDGSPMHGDDNPDALHLAALDDGDAAVATCLVLPRAYPRRPEDEDAWQLRGMATHESLRGQGIGALLVDSAMAEVRARGGAF